MDMVARLDGVGNIGAVLQHHFDQDPEETHDKFCERAQMSTATLAEWLGRDSTRGMRAETLAKFARGFRMEVPDFKRLLRDRTGADTLTESLARSGLVMDPNQWMLAFAEFLRARPERAREIVGEVNKWGAGDR